MKRASALGLVVLVFLAGMAGGVLGARLMMQRLDPPQLREHLGAPPLDRFFAIRELDLSAEQKTQVRELFARYRRSFEDLHRELRPRVESLMEEIDREVEGVLTPEQLEAYRERPRHWRRGPGRRGPGPRRPGRPPEEAPPAPPSN